SSVRPHRAHPGAGTMTREVQDISRESAGVLPQPAGGHWTEIARQWERVGPPLRPCAEDVAIYQSEVDRWSRAHGAPRALILGVTPELYRLRWPAGTDLAAADHTRSMIDAVWPGPRSAVVCADWTD